MRAHRASTTAKIVAAWRALADAGATSVPGFRDPYAAQMLSPAARLTVKAITRRVVHLSVAERAHAIQGFDTIPIRVAAIDQELVRAVREGCTQVVLLGAGFDTRAFRLRELARVRFFEVDHPATQALKQKRSAGLPRAVAEHLWVAVDFERDALAACLERAGHDPRAPTVWVWEGVVMYLADPAVKSTLEAIRARSAPGSALLLHYHEPSPGAVARGLRHAVLSAVGEPQIGVRSRAAMQALVEGAGFAIAKDLGTAEQAAAVGGVAPSTDLAGVSRLLVATA